MGLFNGKVALVTGGASGIGAAAALRYAEEGAAVVVADLNLEGAEAIAEQIRAKGGRAQAVAVDVSKDADNQKMVAVCKDSFGGLDAAFLNAGAYDHSATFDELTIEKFDRMISINLKGTFYGMKAVLPALNKGGAAVVTASAAGLLGLTVAAGYSSAKHGVVGLVKSASRAFAEHGARINAICPGAVATPLVGVTEAAPMQDADALEAPEYRGQLLPQHIAEVALFLTSARSSGINGQAQLVDAGYAAAFPPLDE